MLPVPATIERAGVTAVGITHGAGDRVHSYQLRRLLREARLSPTYLVDRYTSARRRAIVVALQIDLKARLIEATIDMADRLIGAAFTRGKNAQERQYSATAKDVAGLMRMFLGAINPLATAVETEADPIAALDEAVGWNNLLRMRDEVAQIAETADVDRLHITPVKLSSPPEADALADRLDAMLSGIRVTELPHEVARDTGFLSAFTNLRTGVPCPNENAHLAAILADATNLGLTRMAQASQGVTRDQLVWTADAFIREETYKAALARIIDAQHLLPISAVWGDGTTSSSDGQFFRSGRRDGSAREVNARYGVDPGFNFYTHVSDKHDPYHACVISATTHEAPYVLNGLLHHGTGLPIAEHYTDTGGTTDHVLALCTMLGFRFCPRLRDFQDRRLVSIALPSAYPGDHGQEGQGRYSEGPLDRNSTPRRVSQGWPRCAIGDAAQTRRL